MPVAHDSHSASGLDRDPIEPSPDIRPADRTGPAREHEERGLERILGVLRVSKHAAANGVNHRPVPADEVDDHRDQHGEEVKAYVVPKAGTNPSPEEIIAWSKQQMAAYKYPRMVEVVSSLPLGPTGKILKLELRKMDQEARATAGAK